MSGRRMTVGAAVTAALVGAVVYAAIAFAHSINHDLRRPVIPSRPADDVAADPLRVACATDASRISSPANGAVSATDSTGAVKLYAARSEDHIVTVPVSVTNTGDTRAVYTVAVSITLTSGSAGTHVDSSATIDGAIAAHATTSADVTFTGIGSVPLADMDVRVLDVRRQRCPAA